MNTVNKENILFEKHIAYESTKQHTNVETTQCAVEAIG